MQNKYIKTFYKFFLKDFKNLPKIYKLEPYRNTYIQTQIEQRDIIKQLVLSFQLIKKITTTVVFNDLIM